MSVRFADYDRRSLSSIHTDWSCMVAEYSAGSSSICKNNVMDYACSIMRRAKDSIESIVDILIKSGYRFADPRGILRDPDPNAREWLRHYEGKGVYLPVSLQAWIEIIGTVDLRGTHPAWIRSAYIFDNSPYCDDVLFTDPLVMHLDADYLEYQWKEWMLSNEDNVDIHKPYFLLDISPDHIHKSNISGGPPYQLRVDSPAADSLLLNERGCASFMSYIRSSLKWGGFPGLKYIDTSSLPEVEIVRPYLV